MKRFYKLGYRLTRVMALVFMLGMVQGLNAQEVIVSADVTNGYKSQSILPCMIVMQNQWVAPEYIKKWTKEAKGDFVFDHLRTFAHKDQLDIISYFDKEAINYQSFY